MTVFVQETLALKYESHFGHLDGKFQRPGTHLWDHMPTDGTFQLVERTIHALTSRKGYELWSKKV